MAAAMMIPIVEMVRDSFMENKLPGDSIASTAPLCNHSIQFNDEQTLAPFDRALDAVVTL